VALREQQAQLVLEVEADELRGLLMSRQARCSTYMWVKKVERFLPPA